MLAGYKKQNREIRAALKQAGVKGSDWRHYANQEHIKYLSEKYGNKLPTTGGLRIRAGLNIRHVLKNPKMALHYDTQLHSRGFKHPFAPNDCFPTCCGRWKRMMKRLGIQQYDYQTWTTSDNGDLKAIQLTINGKQYIGVQHRDDSALVDGPGGTDSSQWVP